MNFVAVPQRALSLASVMVLMHGVLFPTPARARSAEPVPVEDRAQAIECLTLAIAHEAGYESPEGQQAVAEVVLNRVRHPAYPKSICAVVFAGSTRKTGCQFTFTCDGALRRRLPVQVMAQARLVAEQALDGRLAPLVGDALNYHADYVSPYWAPSLQRVVKIGTHIFYRPKGSLPPGELSVVEAGTAAPASAVEAAPSASAGFAPWGLPPPAASTR